MKIETKNMPDQGYTLAIEAAASEFPVLKQMMDNGECRFAAPLTIKIHALPEHNLIKVKGSVNVDIQLACSRCLALFNEILNRGFTLRFSQEIPSELIAAGQDEIELSAEQMDLIYFDGETIDLREPIQEQVVLALPFKSLCRQNCKGLCPRCGVDLNSETCGCKASLGNNPFTVLKNRRWPVE